MQDNGASIFSIPGIENPIQTEKIDKEKASLTSLIKKLFSKGYLAIPKPLIKAFGLEPAGWIMTLLSWQDHLVSKGVVKEDEYFYLEQSRIEEQIGVSKYKQVKYVTMSRSLGVMEVIRKGLPARNLYWINLEILAHVTGIANDNKLLLCPENDSGINQVIKILVERNLLDKKSSSLTSVSQVALPMEVKLLDLSYKDNIYKDNLVTIDSKESRSDFKKSLNSSLDNPPRTPQSEQPNKKVKPSKRSRYVCRWNSHPQVQHHKENSKTYATAHKYCEQLEQGGRFSADKSLNPEFLSRNKITLNMIDRPMTREEILKTIDDCAKFLQGGYWPRDKEKMPKSFEQMLYNPMSMKSWFMMARFHPPKLLKDFEQCQPKLTEEQKDILDHQKGVTQEIFELISEKDRQDLNILTKVADIGKALIDIHKTFDQGIQQVRTHFSWPFDLARKWRQWLQEQEDEWMETPLIIDNMKPKGQLWDGFIKDMMDRLLYDQHPVHGFREKLV